jgi:thiosulfate/3-mercaptopyruvate sulfurtransferase
MLVLDWTDTDAYDAGHIPGAIGWNWKEWLWDPLTREFPSPEEFARRCARSGISNDTT